MRGTSRVRELSASAAWAESSAASPPWPSVVAEPRMPGPGPAIAASQPSPAKPGVQGPGHRDRVVLSPKRLAGRDVPCQEAARS